MIITFTSRSGFATPLPATLDTAAVVASAALPTPALLPSTQISQVATGNAIAAGLFDTVIIINKAASGPTSVVLPAAGRYLGAALFILDWNGNAATITITPASGELINNKPTWSVTSSSTAPAAIRLIPVNTGGMTGWAQF